MSYDRSILEKKAVRLFVNILTLDGQLFDSIIIIVNYNNTIANLKYEIQYQYKYCVSHQYIVINEIYAFDELKIKDLISNMDKYKDGFKTYLYIANEKEIEDLPGYFVIDIQNIHKNHISRNEFIEAKSPPFIISDDVDMEMVAQMHWECAKCTLKNKPYLLFCTVCLNCRPKDYKIPDDFILTKEDRDYFKKQDEIEEKEKKMKLEAYKQSLSKKQADLDKLRKMVAKDDIVQTSDKIECAICMDEFESGNAVVLRQCLHTFCKECLIGHITDASHPKIECPEDSCCGVLETREITALLNAEQMVKYESLNLRTARQENAGTFNCKTVNCENFVFYDENVNVFKCIICNKENCIGCNAIHEKQTCEQYQTELKDKARNDEAARKDLEFLTNLIKNGEAMNCPKCKIIIQKKQGCDWMMCNMCKTELCWATKGPRWGPNGSGDTSGGCRCKVNNVKCHPQCGNCH